MRPRPLQPVPDELGGLLVSDACGALASRISRASFSRRSAHARSTGGKVT
jgi:hypothetical protein